MSLTVNLIHDPEYKGYVADVRELPGCMSQGKSVKTALRNVREAIHLYLEHNHRSISPFLLRAQILRAGLIEEQFLELL